MRRSRFETLDHALRLEQQTSRRAVRAAQSRFDPDIYHRFDELLALWLAVADGLEAAAETRDRGYDSTFRSGLDEIFCTRALLAFRIATSWALGTRSQKIEAPFDMFPLEQRGDLAVKALLRMVNPWEYGAVVSSIEREVGETLNAYFLMPGGESDGRDALGEMVLFARDYLLRPQYLPSLGPVLEECRVAAGEAFYRPSGRAIADLFYLAAREVIEFGPAMQTHAFSRALLAQEVEIEISIEE